jgi:hypothetical protein
MDAAFEVAAGLDGVERRRWSELLRAGGCGRKGEGGGRERKAED